MATPDHHFWATIDAHTSFSFFKAILDSVSMPMHVSTERFLPPINEPTLLKLLSDGDFLTIKAKTL